MRKILLVFITLWLIVPAIYAQKVGLVLSGGGAKGLTHIGIIRALEENNIPIDYIAGTSMGAIIGSLYAMGYSPDDMVELLKSEDFKRWYSGEVEEKYVYHFKKNLPTPEFFNIRFSFRDSLKSLKPQFLPTSVVNPIQMNLVFVDLYARATAACKGDFDKLFVPFRCIRPAVVVAPTPFQTFTLVAVTHLARFPTNAPRCSGPPIAKTKISTFLHLFCDWQLPSTLATRQ